MVLEKGGEEQLGQSREIRNITQSQGGKEHRANSKKKEG
jgi:hypothetical protein